MTLGLSSIENPALQHPVPGSIIMDDVNDELCQKITNFQLLGFSKIFQTWWSSVGGILQ